MGFSIFVAAGGRGSRPYNYERRNVAFGDEWDFNWFETQLLSRAGISAPDSPTGDAVAHALSAMSHLQQVHLLSTTFTMLLTHGEGTLNMHVSHSHLLWANTGGFRRIRIWGDGTSCALDLVRFLDRVEMTKWGPIIELLQALTEFETQYVGHRDYMINVSLTD